MKMCLSSSLQKRSKKRLTNELFSGSPPRWWRSEQGDPHQKATRYVSSFGFADSVEKVLNRRLVLSDKDILDSLELAVKTMRLEEQILMDNCESD